MSLEILLRRFPVTGTADSVAPGEGGHPVPVTLTGLFEKAAGRILVDGFLRFHTPESAHASYEACTRMIEGIEGRYYPFAFDWSGREFLFDIRDPESKPRYVIMIDPAEGEYYTTGLTIDEFFEAAVDEDEDALAYPSYEEWRESAPEAGPLGFDRVVGYKVPLSLGGSDEVANMEVTDFRVYFELCTQIALQIRDLPEGTPIDGATIARPEQGA